MPDTANDVQSDDSSSAHVVSDIGGATPEPIVALPVDLPTMRGTTRAMTLRNRALSPVAQLFIECAREVAKPLTKKK